jgi:uncharacterized protein (TIGR00730 family)
LARRICVFAGSSAGLRPEYRTVAESLGRALCDHGFDLVYGGARVGLMGAVADAVLAAGGRVFGVIPDALVAKELAHAGVTELHVVASMHERKAMMAELSDGFIALPGGWGTWEELFEVLTWGQLGLHRKPCGALNAGGYFDGLLAFMAHAMQEGFVRSEQNEMLLVADTPAALLHQMAAYTPPAVEKWIEKSET